MKEPQQQHVLVRLDNRDIPAASQEVRLFAFIKDEISRLPYFMEHYRKMGVDRFFFIENSSNDGTREYLLAQPDCHVFFTRNSYKEAKSGIAWTNGLLDIYGTNHWSVVVDADELFIYPHYETVKIQDFCKLLDAEGSEAVYTFMLDMYPAGNISDAVCVPGKSFFEICPYFDKDYTFVNRIFLRGEAPFPPREVIGGPRTRCFYTDQGAHSAKKRMAIHLYERIGVAFKKLGIPLRFKSLKAPALFKVPLIKWQPSYNYTASTHVLNPVKLSAMTGILAHFKFFSDFHARVVSAVKSGQYSNGSAEYKRYLNHFEATGNFMYDGSLKYTSSEDTLKAGLMTSSAALDALAK
jgi:hypothetical protein